MEEDIEPKRKKYCKWTNDKTKLVEALFDSQKSIKYIAERVDMSIRSVQLYIKEHISEELGKPWIPFKRIGPHKKPCLDRRLKITEIINEDNSLIQKQMIDRLPEELKCSRRTLQQDLKALNITRKRLRHVPIERNYASTLVMRRDYAILISVIEDEHLFFVDETGNNLHTNTNYGYCYKGLTPTLEQPGNRGRNHSLVACVGLQGLVHFEIREGAYNTEFFVDFLKNLIVFLPCDAVIVMDNAPIHKGRSVRSLIEESGRRILFLPRYSPQLNPIEQFFAQYKSHQKCIRPRPANSYDLVVSMERAMASVRNQNIAR